MQVAEILLNHGTDIEAQSERTKDTVRRQINASLRSIWPFSFVQPLSLACSDGKYEVVEILLSRDTNKEQRNVSD